MSKSSTHAIVGMGVGISVYIISKYTRNERLTIEGVLGSTILGGIFGLLPDIMEPANNPNHRAFFHSIVTGIGLVGGLKGIAELNKINPDKKMMTYLSGLSYLSHLLLDSMTQKSLPLI